MKIIGGCLILISLITLFVNLSLRKNDTLKIYYQKLRRYIIVAFNVNQGSSSILVALYIIINAIVIINAILHNPIVGYDVSEHLKNVKYLAQFSLPTPQQSAEFFSPPLPYVMPAALYAFLTSLLASLPSIADKVAMAAAGKAAQMVNIFLSLGLTFFLLMLCETLRPGNRVLKITTLGMLAILPVYYKTFAQARPEPYVAFFFVLSMYLIIDLGQGQSSLTKQLALGGSLGLLLLARQWGFFLFPGLVIFFLWRSWQDRDNALYYLKTLGIALFCAFLIGGWFYLYLYGQYGTITAFNRPGSAYFSFSNQPGYFYFDLGLKKLFSSPLRDAFPNRFLPIMYSEIWGDYWGYFLADMYNLSRAPLSLLVRMNVFGIFPTLLLLGGLIFGGYYFFRQILARDRDMVSQGISLMFLVIITSLFAYGWFIIKYPSYNKGDTIKATYLIYIFPFLCLMASEFIYALGKNSSWIQRIIFACLLVVGLHNLQGLITHQWWLRF